MVGEVASKRLGCMVNYVYVDEQISWQGFASGQVDAVLENWGHPELIDLYVKKLHVAQDAGSIGITGQIGWYVPPWMKKKYPDITNWKNLNKYATMFKTSESGGKGQLLDGDPGFVTNDEALVKNLKLNYKVVFAGSEAALIQAFRAGEAKKKPVIGYFYSPQWFLAEVPLVKVQPAEVQDRLRRGPGEGRLRLPGLPAAQDRQRRTFAKSNSTGYRLIKNFSGATRTRTCREVHHRGRDAARGRRPEVDRRQPGQGERLAQVAAQRSDRPAPVRRSPSSCLVDRPGGGVACWGLSHIAHRVASYATIPEEAAHGLGPHHRPRRRHRRRHRRQQPRRTTSPGSGWTRHRPDRQGPAAQPGRLDRPRVELHLPGRPLPRDHRPDPGLGASSTRRWASSPSPAASRSPAPRSGWRSCGAGCRRPRPGASRPSWSARRSWPRRCRSSTPTRSSAPSGRRRSASSTRCAPARSCASAAMASGALTVVPTVEVTGLDVEDGRDHGGSAPTAATSRPRRSSSPAACGAPRSATWPASASR